MTTFTTTFTGTHAREIASRVAADLALMHRYYGRRPSLAEIDHYETEFVELLAAGYLREVEYGFKRNDEWVVCVRYAVREGSGEPQHSGGVDATADIEGAAFYSYLKYSASFLALPQVERRRLKASLPVERTPDREPGSALGHWVSDRSYGAGGISADRHSFRLASR
jgi:hypothetical protein